MKPINLFRGEYGWLSNYRSVDIKVKGITYASVEHAWLSYKSDDPEWKVLCSDGDYDAKNIKKISKFFELPQEFLENRDVIMKSLLVQKFAQPWFRIKLLETKSREIIEGNWWNDTYWGVDMKTGIGENRLGKIIMEIRTILKKLDDDGTFRPT